MKPCWRGVLHGWSLFLVPVIALALLAKADTPTVRKGRKGTKERGESKERTFGGAGYGFSISLPCHGLKNHASLDFPLSSLAPPSST